LRDSVVRGLVCHSNRFNSTPPPHTISPMHHPQRNILTLLTLLLLAPLAQAFGPQNTAVVLNADSFASCAVANEYISLRNMPPANVIELHLADLRNFEEVGIDDFRTRILQPILQTLKDRGLITQIDCITYSADLPYAINVNADVKNTKLPQIITP